MTLTSALFLFDLTFWLIIVPMLIGCENAWSWEREEQWRREEWNGRVPT